MNFRSLFGQLRQTRRFKTHTTRARQTIACTKFEHLEQRTLLAGNVTVQLLGQSALVTGDAADNAVQVLAENGNVVVRGTDGTTINGSSDDFVLVQGGTTLEGSLTATFSSGENSLSVDGVTVGSSVMLTGGSGVDRLAILGNSQVRQNVTLAGGGANDVLTVQDTQVGGSLSMLGGFGHDLLVVSSSSIGHRLRVAGHAGSDDIVIEDTQVGADIAVRGGRGHDDIVLQDSSAGRNIRLLGNQGNDVIFVDASQAGRRAALRGGLGHDSIVVQGATTVARRLLLAGGPGTDRVQADSEVSAGRFRTRSMRGSVNADLLDERITNSETGALAAASAALGVFDARLTLSLDNSEIAESAGAAAAVLTVSRTSDTDEAVTVSLATSPADQNRLSLGQTSVIIPAGQSSVTVPVNAVNNTAVDGSSTITITATGEGLTSGNVQIIVTDDDTSALTLTPAETQVFEDTGSPTTVGNAVSVQVTVARSGDTAEAETVTLSTPDAGRINVPASVEIPAGQASATFAITTIPETTVNADNTVVTINATSQTLGTAQTQITLVDTDAPSLLVEFAAPTISEDGTLSVGQTTLEVSRNTATTSALTVQLAVSPTGRMQLASNTITIPAGQTSATVAVSGIDDDLVNGDSQVSVTASATDFADGSETIVVTDDDAATLTLTVTSGDSVAENAGAGAVTASVTRNTVDATTPLVVAVAVTGDSRVAGPSTVTIPAGQTTASFALDVIDNDVIDPTGTGPATITVSTSDFTSASDTVSVIDDDQATLSLTPADADYNEDAGAGGASLTLTREDSDTAETVTLTYSDTLLVSGDTSVQFGVGETQKVVNVDIIDNSSFLDNNDVIVTASAPGRASVQARIGIINDDVLTLTTDFGSNVFTPSVGTLVTKNSTFTITGQTAPGATIQVETSGDGQFDDLTATATETGAYRVDVPLTRTETNGGANTIQVRAAVTEEVVDAVAPAIDVFLAEGTVVRFGTNQDFNNDGSSDFYDIELLDEDAPVTVANFMSYVEDGSYQDMFIHRAPPSFVIQGGGFRVNDSVISSVPAKPTIPGEFSAANPNVRGTLSMAHTGQPDTGSSQWFVNVVNNSPGLDVAQHTVFGRVIGDGMDVVDAIAALPIQDVSLLYNGNTNFTTTPFSNDLQTPLTGTVTLTNGSAVIIGNGTQFTSELNVGDLVRIGGQQLFVTDIASNVQLTVDLEAGADANGLVPSLIRRPVDDEFVIFSNIAEILDSI